MGAELFQIEKYDASRPYLSAVDPIQIALGILSGKLDAAKFSPIQEMVAGRR